jgi:predicted metalloprotease with PDZ domain
MHHFMWRATTAVLVVLAAFALSASAQAPSNTSSDANKIQPTVQPNAGATNVPQPGAVQPGATPRARAAQRPVVAQPQVNPDVARQRELLTRPGTTVQPAAPGATARVRTGVRDGVIQTDQGDFATRTTLPNQPFIQQRTVLRPGEMRGPDFGVWFNRPVRDGLVISDIGTVGPITRLGFREGDRIISVNGHAVTTERQFVDFLMADTLHPAQVVVFRNGRNETVVVDPTFFTEQQTFVADVAPLEQFGIVLDDRFTDRVVVWRVLPGTPAFYAGFRPGDVITTLSGQPFRTRLDFENAIVAMRPGEIPVRIARGDRLRDLIVDVPQFQRTAMRTGQPVGDRLDKREVLRDEVRAEGIEPRIDNPDQRPYLQNPPRSERR